MSFIDAKHSKNGSYFYAAMAPRRKGKNLGDLGSYRCRDGEYLERENKTGVAFFGKGIFDSLKTELSVLLGGDRDFDDADILEQMDRVFRSQAENLNDGSLTQHERQQLINDMKSETLSNLEHRCNLKQKRVDYYHQYRKKPYVQDLPEMATDREKTIVNNIGFLKLNDRASKKVDVPSSEEYADFIQYRNSQYLPLRQT